MEESHKLERYILVGDLKTQNRNVFMYLSSSISCRLYCSINVSSFGSLILGEKILHIIETGVN